LRENNTFNRIYVSLYNIIVLIYIPCNLLYLFNLWYQCSIL